MLEWIYAANQEAASYFINALCSTTDAIDYLRDRGLDDKMIRRSWAGYADGYLTSHLRSLGYTDDILIGAGLSIRGEDGQLFDRFRKRVMFPVFDWNYRIVGFSGRLIADNPDAAKYLNTPATQVFQKGNVLFGWNDMCWATGFQLGASQKLPYLIMCEGNLDVVSLHQAGFNQSAASLGTAFTKEQAAMIEKITGLVVLAYDSDKAGMAATKRNIAILRQAGVRSRVLIIKGAKDPDEYLKKFGPEAFRGLLSGAIPSYEWEMLYAEQKIMDGQDEFLRWGEPAAYTRAQEEAMKAFGDEFLALDVRSKDHLDGYALLLSERYPWLKKDSILGYINNYMLSNFMPEGPGKTA